MSRDDQSFLALVINSSVQVEGHYQIALLLRHTDIPNNKKVVEQRLRYLKRRFQKDSMYHADYNTFMNELLVKGYA